MPSGTLHPGGALCPVTTGPCCGDRAAGPGWEPCRPALLLTKLFPDCAQRSQGGAWKGEQASLSCRESDTWHFSSPTRQTTVHAHTAPHPTPCSSSSLLPGKSFQPAELLLRLVCPHPQQGGKSPPRAEDTWLLCHRSPALAPRPSPFFPSRFHRGLK